MASDNSNRAVERGVVMTGNEGEMAGAVATGERRQSRASRRRMLGGAAKLAAAGIGAGVLAVQAGGQRALAASGVAPLDNVGIFSSSVTSTPAVTAGGSNGAIGVIAGSDSGTGISASSTTGVALRGQSSSSIGVAAFSQTNTALTAVSNSGSGVLAQSSANGFGLSALSVTGDAVLGTVSDANASASAIHGVAPGATKDSSGVACAVFAEGGTHPGVYATTTTGIALQGTATSGTGVKAFSNGGSGVVGTSFAVGGFGVQGTNPSGGVAMLGDATFNGTGTGIGVKGQSDLGTAVYGLNASPSSYAIQADNPVGSAILGNATHTGTGSGTGVTGVSDIGKGTVGTSTSGPGVFGTSTNGYGVDAFSTGGTALHAKSAASNGTALFAEGLLRIAGAAVGQATIPQNLTSVTVATAAVTANSHILLTPLGNPRGALWISNIVPGTSFQINVGVDVFFPAGLVVQYLIIN